MQHLDDAAEELEKKFEGREVPPILWFQSGYLVYGYNPQDLRNTAYYADTDEKVDFDNLRPCRKCNKDINFSAQDPCLKWMEGVSATCCGHGIMGETYIFYKDGTIYRGEEADEQLERI